MVPGIESGRSQRQFPRAKNIEIRVEIEMRLSFVFSTLQRKFLGGRVEIDWAVFERISGAHSGGERRGIMIWRPKNRWPSFDPSRMAYWMA
jgi:hypothetical protein